MCSYWCATQCKEFNLKAIAVILVTHVLCTFGRNAEDRIRNISNIQIGILLKNWSGKLQSSEQGENGMIYIGSIRTNRSYSLLFDVILARVVLSAGWADKDVGRNAHRDKEMTCMLRYK